MRIAQQIAHAFGVDIDKDIVRRVLAKHYRPGDSGSPGPSWLSVLAQTNDSLWSLDLFRCESIILRSHCVLVVMDVFTRPLSASASRWHPLTGSWSARCSTTPSPDNRYGSTTAPTTIRCFAFTAGSPIYACSRSTRSSQFRTLRSRIHFVERLIGTIRREYFDHVFFWNAVDLARKLGEFRDYYNARRVHRSLGGTPPAQRTGGSAAPAAALDHYDWQQHCRGLFQLPLAA